MIKLKTWKIGIRKLNANNTFLGLSYVIGWVNPNYLTVHGYDYHTGRRIFQRTERCNYFKRMKKICEDNGFHLPSLFNK